MPNTEDESIDEMVEQILSRLSLQDSLLSISFDYPERLALQGVATLLRSTHRLKNLAIERADISLETCQSLCEALDVNTTVTKLSIPGCVFFDGAFATLANFVQTKANRGGSVLRSVLLAFFDLDMTRPLFRDTMSQIASMVSNSAIECLEIGEYGVAVKQFYDGLLTHAPTVRLLELRLCPPKFQPDGIPTARLYTLAQFLAQTTTLQTLHVENIMANAVQRDRTATVMLHALRQNGSICHMSLLWGRDNNPFFTPDEQILVDAFTTRNSQIPKLLELGSKDDMRMVPLLMAAAQPARIMAPNNIFSGLLTASSTCGPMAGGTMRLHTE